MQSRGRGGGVVRGWQRARPGCLAGTVTPLLLSVYSNWLALGLRFRVVVMRKQRARLRCSRGWRRARQIWCSWRRRATWARLRRCSPQPCCRHATIPRGTVCRAGNHHRPQEWICCLCRHRCDACRTGVPAFIETVWRAKQWKWEGCSRVREGLAHPVGLRAGGGCPPGAEPFGTFPQSPGIFCMRETDRYSLSDCGANPLTPNPKSAAGGRDRRGAARRGARQPGGARPRPLLPPQPAHAGAPPGRVLMLARHRGC